MRRFLAALDWLPLVVPSLLLLAFLVATSPVPMTIDI